MAWSFWQDTDWKISPDRGLDNYRRVYSDVFACLMKIPSAAHNLSFSPSTNARDLRAGNDDGDFSDTGDAAICGEREPYFQITGGSTLCFGGGKGGTRRSIAAD